MPRGIGLQFGGDSLNTYCTRLQRRRGVASVFGWRLYRRRSKDLKRFTISDQIGVATLQARPIVSVELHEGFLQTAFERCVAMHGNRKPYQRAACGVDVVAATHTQPRPAPHLEHAARAFAPSLTLHRYAIVISVNRSVAYAYSRETPCH